VLANDIDPLAAAALRENLSANAVTGVEVVVDDLLSGTVPDVQVVVAGDVCYQRGMAERTLAWLRACHDAGLTVLLGDPGRAFLPPEGLRELARFPIVGDPVLENANVTSAAVYTFAAPALCHSAGRTPTSSSRESRSAGSA
jgi:predicted nicotinamide N-methyase